ncbi:hypothetical protein NCER_102345, partial [Vairimorpha ceranae BRL01]
MLPMKFLFLIVCLLFCEDLKDLLKERLNREKFEPVSAGFLQNKYNIAYKIIFNYTNLKCRTFELGNSNAITIFKQKKFLESEYNFFPDLETEILKNIYFNKNEEKNSTVHFTFFNIYDKKIQNIYQQTFNSIIREHPNLCIIPELDLCSFPQLSWNFLTLDENYQPAFHIPCIKYGRIDTIKIAGKDLNLVDHFKNNLLQVIKYDIDQKEFNRFFDDFDFVKFVYYNPINDIGLLDESKKICEAEKDECYDINECLDCQRKNITADWNEKMEQNQESKDILS